MIKWARITGEKFVRPCEALVFMALMLMPVSAPCANPFLEEHKPDFHALIFTNADYRFIDHVESVIADDRIVRKTLAELGFRTYDGLDSTFSSKTEFLEKLDDIFELNEIHPGDVVLFYYSGHGFSWEGRNYLLPLDYPAGEFNSQRLPSQVPYLDETINKIRELRPGLILAILDSCREDITFEISRFGKKSEAKTKNIRNGFSPSSEIAIEAWYATNNRGQALGGSISTVPSVFTGHVVKLFKETEETIPDRFQILLQSVFNETMGQMRPERAAHSSMNRFDFRKDHIDWEAIKTKWERVLGTDNPETVKSYLTLLPWSQFAQAAKEWLKRNQHRKPPSTQVDPVLVERGFDAVAGTNELAAIIQNNFDVRFLRTASQSAVRSSEDQTGERLGFVTGLNRSDVYRKATNLIAAVGLGDKRSFDAARLETRSEIANTGIGRFVEAPRVAREGFLPQNIYPRVTLVDLTNAPDGSLSATLNRKFDDVLMPRRFGVPGAEPEVLPPQVMFTYNAPRAAGDYTLIIGRAIGEVIVPPATPDTDDTEIDASILVEELERLKRERKIINRVSIAPTWIEDPSEAEVPPNPNPRQERINREQLSADYRQRLAAREMRTAHIREILIQNGIDRRVITVALGAAGNIGFGTRVRILGF